MNKKLTIAFVLCLLLCIALPMAALALPPKTVYTEADYVGRPSGLTIVKTGMCELDYNANWIGGCSNSESLTDLPGGHMYGFYIQFRNRTNRTISFELRVYQDDEEYSSDWIVIEPNYQYTWWTYPSSRENERGTFDFSWYINGSRELTKTFTISR